MSVIIPLINLVCVLFGTVIPTSSFNFIQLFLYLLPLFEKRLHDVQCLYVLGALKVVSLCTDVISIIIHVL